MKNKNVGFLIIGIAIVMAIIVLLFNNVIRQNIGLTCSHGPSCEMYTDVKVQTYISLSIVAVIFVIGLFLIFAKEEKEIVQKIKKVEIEKRYKPLDYSKLDKEEKTLARIIEENKGSIFQADLVEKSQFSKVKVTRVLDRLEAKQLIERKRRGMTNVVLLK